MHVLVTGGAGFIGTNFVRMAVNGELIGISKVTVLDKLTYAGVKANLDSFINSPGFTFVKGDICDPVVVGSILNEVDSVINFAAESHVDRSIDGPKQFIESNVLGVFNLLESIRNYKKKIKLIHISTDEVYGDIKKNNKSKENDSYNPSSPYSASKASGDLLIKSYIRTYKIPAIITNCCNNFGPKQYPEKLIPTIIYNILNCKPIPIYGKGKNIREWIYVKDHCDALFKVAQKGIIGESYNIGSGTILNNIQIVKRIISVFKKMNHNQNIISKINLVKDRPGHDFRYCLNSSKIKSKLKWNCESSFDQRLNETIIWYINKFRNNYFKNKDFKYRIGLKA